MHLLPVACVEWVLGCLVAVASVCALIVDHGDDWRSPLLAILREGIGHGLKMPALATPGTLLVNDWLAVGEGHVISGGIAHAFDASHGGPAGYCRAAVVVPSEG